MIDARWRRTGFAMALACIALASAPASAEAIKIGLGKVAANGANFIAIDKGYFAAEGLDASVVLFDSAEPITLAVVSGDIDFGATGPGGAFYNLAGKNEVTIISGLAREAPGFPVFVFAVSNAAFQAGFKSYKDMAGHTGSVTQLGAAAHYAYALLEQKFGVDPKSVRILPLQTQANQMSAITGGQADSGVVLASVATAGINRGDVTRIGLVGDEITFQTGIVFTSTKAANGKPDMVRRFLNAYRKGAAAYRDAFTGPNGQRRDGPTAAEMLAIIAKYVGQPVEQVRSGISYVDPEAALDVNDILRQLAWYKAQGMVKAEVSGDQVIDKRYVIPATPR